MQHSGSVDMNPDIFEIAFFFLTRTNSNKNERIKKCADSLLSCGPKADTMKVCGFKNTRIHLDGASERGVSKAWGWSQGLSFIYFIFFFAKNAVLGLGLELGLTRILTLNLTLKQHSSFVQSCLVRIFLHAGSGNYMRKSIHYNNDKKKKKKKKKKKNFYINYLSNTKHISNFPRSTNYKFMPING